MTAQPSARKAGAGARTVLSALNEGLHLAMERDPSVFLLGEDILDPYGGAFKVTRGLSSRFPDRVLTTPISEGAITGVAAGMAMRGLRPVVEIMFGDFLSLAFDQLLNHACKFRWMYNRQVRVPMVVRTPMGGRRGYGPTHSQSMEKYFLGVPGLRVVAPNTLDDPAELLDRSIRTTGDPLLFVEHKLLYTREVRDAARLAELEIARDDRGTLRVRLAGAPAPSVTIACYGYMAELALEAMTRLAMESEVFAETLVFTELAPLDAAPLLDFVARTRRLVVAEEGTGALGWGAEIAAVAAEKLGARQGLAIRRVAARDLPIPSTRKLEDVVLPGAGEIVAAALATGG
jgi:pyruvate/2-oxoglutarate/acetoin dehydrogenase E1 component